MFVFRSNIVLWLRPGLNSESRYGKIRRQNVVAVGIQNLKPGPNQSTMLKRNTNIALAGVSIESLLLSWLVQAARQ